MANSYVLNFLTRSEGEAVWRLKEALVTAGWSVARSGDGLAAFGASSDVLSPGGPYPLTGANSLDNTNAWFEVRENVSETPRRSLLVQKTSTAGAWRWWYSSDGTGFTGGTPSATVRGTAADEQGLVNTPAGTTQWLPQNVGGVFYLDLVIGGAAEGYSFFFGARRQTVAGYSAIMALDVLENTHGLDADGAVVITQLDADATRFADFSSAGLGNTASQVAGCPRGWYKKGLGGAAFVTYPPCGWGNQEGGIGTDIPRNLGGRNSSDFSTFAYQELPVHYIRGGSTHTTERGYKGRSRLFRQTQQNLGQLRMNVGRTRANLGAVSIPWDGATAPII